MLLPELVFKGRGFVRFYLFKYYFVTMSDVEVEYDAMPVATEQKEQVDERPVIELFVKV